MRVSVSSGLVASALLVVACGKDLNKGGETPKDSDTSVLALANCDLSAPFGAPVAAFTGSMDADGLTFSADGLTAYISGAGPGNRDIYVATRGSLEGTFSTPTLVAAVNTPGIERAPSLSPDGKLYFTKQPSSMLDIGRALGTAPQFTGAEVVPAPISSPWQDEDPFWWGNNTLYFVSEVENGGAQRDIWMTTLSGSTFSPPTKVQGQNLNSSAEEYRPILSPDGLTLYFGSRRFGIGNDSQGDVWMARRTSVGAAFAAPVNLWGMNSSGTEYPVTVSADGCTLYFASNEETGLGLSQNLRLYQATRGTSTPAQVTLRLNILGSGSVTQPPFNCGPGNTGTCSASAPPDTTMIVNASSQAQWTGSCSGNGGTPSTDGVVVFSQNAVCTIKFPDGNLVGVGGLCSLSMDCQPGLTCVNNTCGLGSKITFDKPQVCNGESVRMTVDTRALSGTPKFIMVNGAPIGTEFFDQVLSAPGQHIYAVTTVAADGTSETVHASIPVVACPTAAPTQPVLIARHSYFDPESVDLTVLNAARFEGATYHWDFGDGTTLATPLAAVSHDFASTIALDVESKPFHVAVTVTKPGQPDASAKRTFTVYNNYAIARSRGSLEPPTEPVDPVLRRAGNLVHGAVKFSNREPTPITYNQWRFDAIPCNGDAPIVYGTTRANAITVPANGTVPVSFQIPQSEIASGACGLAVHYWGATNTGVKAQASVEFDFPPLPGQGVPPDAATAAVLNYAVSNGLVSNPFRVSEKELVRLYRERKLPLDATVPVLAQAPPSPPRLRCNPEDPNDPALPPPQLPGFTCQFAGGWEGTAEGGTIAPHIQNAMKGDAIVIRECSGLVNPLLGAVTPPQKFTHSGLMTKHRFEVTQSTGALDWLKEHPNGVAGQPSDGFEEQALKFLWPGTMTVSVEETFGEGRAMVKPEGGTMRVHDFIGHEVRCHDDNAIVYPRVVKPPPELDAQVRTQLMAAADFGKTIQGHYRFGSYSDALASPIPDPDGPGTTPNAPLGTAYGKVPTVCSQFVRFSLQGAGFEMDRDKTLPKPSHVPSQGQGGAPDGLFLYTETERRQAADVLYQAVYNRVERELALLEGDTDDYWWVGLAATPILGPGALVATPGLLWSGTVVKWATDAPDDVANQVTNCFASDFCSEDAKDSEDWKNPGRGIAVSPDNIVDHYDSPLTGGPYGYHERMIYRGKDYKPVYEWRPAAGSLRITGRVVMPDQAPVPFASVTIPGFLNTPIQTDASGAFLIEGVPGGNLLFHAQKLIEPPSPGTLHEGDACYVWGVVTVVPPLIGLRRVDCNNFSVFPDGPGVVATEVRIVLNPPREIFRRLRFEGDVTLSNCVCGEVSPHNATYNNLLDFCTVSPLTLKDTVHFDRTDLCANQIGLDYEAECQWLPDNSVRVHRKYQLFEDGGNSCGGSDLEYAPEHTSDIPPGARICFHQDDNGQISTTCITGAVCHDRFNADFCITNEVAP